LGRGALGDAIDGCSREGKFIRRIEAELLYQLGDNELARKLRRAHAEGQIDAADAEAFSGAIETRRGGLAGKSGETTRRRPKGVLGLPRASRRMTQPKEHGRAYMASESSRMATANRPPGFGARQRPLYAHLE
jgi:hypothetical protein